MTARAPVASSDAEIDAFVARAREGTPEGGRLVFGLDATMSRQATWDMACALHAEMFDAVRDVGALSVKLAYYRGHREARATRWLSDPEKLARVAGGIACMGGRTQIGRLLALVERDAGDGPSPVFVFVGDCVEENIDALCDRAGRLSLHGVRAFMFQEGDDPVAARAFGEIARLTGGVHRRFDAAAARSLKALLTAAAVYAAGGRRALLASRDATARGMLEDLT
jgi:hypothetical protein